MGTRAVRSALDVMPFFGWLAVVGLVLLVGPVPLARADETATVIAVVDGDTLIVDIAGTQARVRVCGIDAPERASPRDSGERMAGEATEFARRLVLGRRVRLRAETGVPDRDRHGRLLRHVQTPDGESLAEQLLSAGLAVVFRKTESIERQRFEQIERDARARGVGQFGLR